MKACMRVGSWLAGCALFGLASLVACGGGGGSGGFGSGSDPSASSPGAESDASNSDDRTVESSDDGGPTGVFTSSDAAVGVLFDCQPGTYAGTFTTMVSSDAGGLLSLFSFNWTGNLSITLQGRVTNTGAGEIPEPTLAIAPGAKLAGVDTMGGHFDADMSGKLDCPSKTLTATVADGSYNYFGDAGGIAMTGTMSATYDGSGSTPMLTGTLNLSSPQLSGIAAIGGWSATLQ
jgi:hypothetical protein